jgi:hypothetical protein
MKILPVGADLSYADGRTDRHTDITKVVVIFHNFSKAHKNCRKNFIFPKHFMLRMIRTIKGHYLPTPHSLSGIISNLSALVSTERYELNLYV